MKKYFEDKIRIEELAERDLQLIKFYALKPGEFRRYGIKIGCACPNHGAFLMTDYGGANGERMLDEQIELVRENGCTPLITDFRL